MGGVFHFQAIRGQMLKTMQLELSAIGLKNKVACLLFSGFGMTKIYIYSTNFAQVAFCHDTTEQYVLCIKRVGQIKKRRCLNEIFYTAKLA